MERRMEQRRLPAELSIIVNIFRIIVAWIAARIGQFRDVEEGVPSPCLCRRNRRLDLSIPRRELPERNQRASAGGVVEGDGAE